VGDRWCTVPRAWLAHRTPVSEADAGRLVKNARIADGHDEIAASLADGDITTPHVEAIGRVTSSARLPLLADHAGMLVEQAKRLPVGDFTTVMRRWASLADDHLSKDSPKRDGTGDTSTPRPASMDGCKVTSIWIRSPGQR